MILNFVKVFGRGNKVDWCNNKILSRLTIPQLFFVVVTILQLKMS